MAFEVTRKYKENWIITMNNLSVYVYITEKIKFTISDPWRRWIHASSKFHARYRFSRRLGLEVFTETQITVPLTGFRWGVWLTGICWINVQYGEANHTGCA